MKKKWLLFGISLLIGSGLWADISSIGVLLVNDASGSMKSNDRYGLRKKAGQYLISRLQEGDCASVGNFSVNVQLTFVNEPITNRNSKSLQQSISYSNRGQKTDIDGMLKTVFPEVLQMSVENFRKAVIIISDGKDDYQGFSPAILESYRQRGIPVFPLVLGQKTDQGRMKEIAASTGGKQYALTTRNYKRVIDDILKWLRQRPPFPNAFYVEQLCLPAHAQLTASFEIKELAYALDVYFLGDNQAVKASLVLPYGEVICDSSAAQWACQWTHRDQQMQWHIPSPEKGRVQYTVNNLSDIPIKIDCFAVLDQQMPNRNWGEISVFIENSETGQIFINQFSPQPYRHAAAYPVGHYNVSFGPEQGKTIPERFFLLGREIKVIRVSY